jgi:type IV pilus assembly protein PilY1
MIYYDDATDNSKACYGSLNSDGTCNGTSKNINKINYLWSAAGWLNEISDTNILLNRSPYISNAEKRYMFTWNDLNNYGIVDRGTEILPFIDKNGANDMDWVSLIANPAGVDRGPIPVDFGVATNAALNTIVRWIRGLDQTGMRSRQVAVDADGNGVPDSEVTWRLGDVIHSAPVAVSRPVEAYHYLYRDTSYAEFAAQYQNRRHVIYFGGNDGMLHAVNGGFYDVENKRFCRSEDCLSEDTAPELRAELWAYVPYNLLAHLKCLTVPDYAHKYYIDLEPQVFDV